MEQTTQAERLLLEWQKRIERLVAEVVVIHHHRELWWKLNGMIRDAELPPSIMFNAFGHWYATTQFVAIRRLVDRRKDGDSFVRLIDDIARNPSAIDRAVFVGLHDADDEAVANRDFDRYAGPGLKQIPRSTFVADRDDLLRAVDRVKRFADETIAHRRPDRASVVPTFQEIDDATDVLSAVANRYSGLLRAVHMAFFKPIIESDWRAPFRQVWLKKGSA